MTSCRRLQDAVRSFLALNKDGGTYYTGLLGELNTDRQKCWDTLPPIILNQYDLLKKVLQKFIPGGDLDPLLLRSQ